MFYCSTCHCLPVMCCLPIVLLFIFRCGCARVFISLTRVCLFFVFPLETGTLSAFAFDSHLSALSLPAAVRHCLDGTRPSFADFDEYSISIVCWCNTVPGPVHLSISAIPNVCWCNHIRSNLVFINFFVSDYPYFITYLHSRVDAPGMRSAPHHTAFAQHTALLLSLIQGMPLARRLPLSSVINQSAGTNGTGSAGRGFGLGKNGFGVRRNESHICGNGNSGNGWHWHSSVAALLLANRAEFESVFDRMLRVAPAPGSAGDEQLYVSLLAGTCVCGVGVGSSIIQTVCFLLTWKNPPPPPVFSSAVFFYAHDSCYSHNRAAQC
jgi:hypothetical protein